MRTERQVDAFLRRARGVSADIAARTRVIAVALRKRNGAPDSLEGDAIAAELRARNEELTLCMEELKAQQECLVEGVHRLERERAYYADLFERAPDAYVTTDSRGFVVEGNRAAAALLGVDTSALPGQPVMGFVARGDTRAFRRQLAALAAAPTNVTTFETRIRPRGAFPFDASMVVRVIRASSGDALAYRWTIRNAAQRPPSTTLEAHELLRAAIHALRTPIATVATRSKLLCDGALEEAERSPALEETLRNALSAQAVVDELAQLVAFVQDGEGPSTVAFPELVSHAVDAVRGLAAGLGVRLAFESDERPVPVRTHPVAVTWALRRLLDQAVNVAGPQRTATVRVKSDARDAILVVRATGAESLAASALTVAMARTLIERQGGELRVPERTERGELFELRLPLDRVLNDPTP
jgi:PAS domain S-box-containing protein